MPIALAALLLIPVIIAVSALTTATSPGAGPGRTAMLGIWTSAEEGDGNYSTVPELQDGTPNLSSAQWTELDNALANDCRGSTAGGR